MKIYLSHEWTKKTILLRSVEVFPALTLSLYKNYKIESIRFSWLGFNFGLYKE